ncbi:xanthine dehydrogenase family protein molybdopterin-binding subunit [Streptomyces sp. NPDC094034]|uniref:xanthine dehydrogenase family protein molybdopterin-binding subunit n=1 Tax=Streptomyces sp. NPDC094034 TaxID=3155309 RepID=UPI00332CE652
MSRVDGRLKVTGQADYAADHDLPGLVHAVLVTSTVSRATITGIDTDRARSQPGVLDVVTDFSGVTLPFPSGEINFFGQPLAVVLADTLQQAQHGASQVTVRAATLPAVTSMDDPRAVPVPDEEAPDYSRGDADAALRAASTVVDHTFTMAREYHNPMELPATVAHWTGSTLTLWDKTQWVQGNARNIAAALNVPVTAVRVICPFIGGAFGNAGRTWPHQILAAHAARHSGRPVKLVLTRRQMYSGVGYRPASRQRLAMAAGRDGRITGIVHEGSSENCRYEAYSDDSTELAKLLYACENVRTAYRLVPIDVSAATFMRGPGTVTGAFALETTMDELADRLGIDPIELRLRNMVDHHQVTGVPFTDQRLGECLEVGARAFGWSRRRSTPRTRREGDVLIGMGVAAAAHHNNRTTASAAARINADGTALVTSATADMGPGTYTSMVQVAADALGLAASRVRFELGDSTLPTAPMHSGSKTLASVGSAVFTACSTARDGVVRMAVVDPASPLYGVDADTVTVRDGHLSAPGRSSERYGDVLRRHGRDSVTSQRSWTPVPENEFSSFAFGAVFAEVSVDVRLGQIRVRRMRAVYDIGQVVNPKLSRSQVYGGLVAGMGMALLEDTARDHRDGRIVNANMADYLVPVHADVPDLDVQFLSGDDPAATPIGVKGLGELVVVGVPAAIGNAVYNATGVRVRDLPITLDRLLHRD